MLVYFALAFLLTISGNVPMNQAPAAEGLPESPEKAAEIWAAYSPRWQLLNQIRTLASGAALLLTGLGLRLV